ncbi:MAG TPA: hypothetical protein VFF06_27030 [Polyangia bacterium]|nr:hypothetical protein [Polyangia bacterium]
MRVSRALVGALVVGGMVGQASGKSLRRGNPFAADGTTEIDRLELARAELKRLADSEVDPTREVLLRRPAAFRPFLSGGSLALAVSAHEVWVADTENGTVAVSDESGQHVLRVIAVGEAPEQVVVGPDGRGFVTVRDAGEVAMIAPGATEVKARMKLGGEPYGLALAADGKTLFVSLARSGVIVALDAASLAERFRVAVDADPRGLAVSPDGEKLFVAHLTGRSVSVIDLAAAELGRGAGAIRRIGLPGADRGEMARLAGAGGRMPNLTFAIALSPSGHRAYVPHVLEDTGQNVQPEVRSSGYGAGTFDPIVATLTAIDADAEELIDPSVDNATSLSMSLRGFSQPRAVLVDPVYSRVFVAGLGSDDVRVLGTGLTDPLRSSSLPGIYIGANAGPKGLAISPDGKRLYVHAAFKHELVVADVSEPRSWQPKLSRLRVGEEKWPAAAVHGREIFFSNRDSRVSAGQQFACGSCHPEGKQDGMTWRLDKGPRQTPVLAGRLVGTEPYNWLGTRGSLVDNMKDTMGRLGGSGLPRKDLEDLELFITHYLDPGPERAARELSSLEAHGKRLFESDEVGCAHCHTPGGLFTDGKNHDIGTTTSEELQRILAENGQPMPPQPKVDVSAVVRVALTGLSTTQFLRAIGGRPTEPTPGSDLVVAALVNQAFLGGAQQLNQFDGVGLASLGRQRDVFAAADRLRKNRKKPAGPKPTRLAYNTPSLVGVAATAPYLHDGSAQSLRELLTVGNPNDRMGRTSHLAPADIDALVAYLETL